MDKHELINFGDSLPERDEVALQKLLEMITVKNPAVVEIGSRKGCSASVIGGWMKKIGGHLYCVDHWTENTGLVVFRVNIRVLELQDYVHPLVMKSAQASQIFADNTLDLVFIDGDHYYKSVMEDIASWYPKLKKNGIICGHDCERYFHQFTKDAQVKVRDFVMNMEGGGYGLDMGIHAGVVLAVNDSYGEDYEIISGSSIWYRRRK